MRTTAKPEIYLCAKTLLNVCLDILIVTMSDQIVKQTNLCVINTRNKHNQKFIIFSKPKLFARVVSTMAEQWHCGEESQFVCDCSKFQNMNSYHILSKLLLLRNLLLVDKCSSEKPIQPTEKDGCPLYLVHGGPGYCQMVCS